MNSSMEKIGEKYNPETTYKKKPIRMGYFQIVARFVHIYIYNNKNQTKRECKFESGGLGRIGGRA